MEDFSDGILAGFMVLAILLVVFLLGFGIGSSVSRESERKEFQQELVAKGYAEYKAENGNIVFHLKDFAK